MLNHPGALASTSSAGETETKLRCLAVHGRARTAQACTFQIDMWCSTWMLSTLRYEIVKSLFCVPGDVGVIVTYCLFPRQPPVMKHPSSAATEALNCISGLWDVCKCWCASRAVRRMCVFNQKCRAGAAFLLRCARDHGPSGR